MGIQASSTLPADTRVPVAGRTHSSCNIWGCRRGGLCYFG